jgi:hypothetical protein
MNIASSHLAALRALLAGDDSTLDRLTSGATAADETALAALAVAAFLAAARERFTAEWTTADVIRFVARARTHGSFSDLSPSLAESLLTGALSRDKPYRAPEEDDSAYAQMVLLRVLSAELREPELDHLIEQSRQQAGQWLAARQDGSASPEVGRDQNADGLRTAALEQRVRALEEREARRDAEHEAAEIGRLRSEILAMAARIDALEAGRESAPGPDPDGAAPPAFGNWRGNSGSNHLGLLDCVR